MKTRTSFTAALFLFAIFIGLTAFAAPAGATKVYEPTFQPKMTITKSSTPIEIDGTVTFEEWKSAGRTANFVERFPGDNTEPDVSTEVYITYGQDHLYVAYVCYDDPAKIRATMCQRDQFSGDDAVCLLIDTYGSASWAYEFFVNPYGVQKDVLWTTVVGEDPGFDLIWQAAAQVTDSGYQVEMAIPFSSMRFPSNDVQSWRIDFWRNRPRETFNQYSWAAYDRNEGCWPCQWGVVEGIADVKPGKGLEILPSYVATQSSSLANRYDGSSPFEDGDIMGDPALNGKYSLSSDVTIEATLNPDFSQIEGDAAQIDVNTTIALFFPERRPFFQEGSDIFRTLFNSFYTRTVNDPDFAAKVTGRMDKTTFGFLTAHDENTPYMIPMRESSITMNTGGSTINVLRGMHSFGTNSQVGFILTDRRFDGGGSGTIAALDGDIRLSQRFAVDGQFLLSHIKEIIDPSFTSGGTVLTEDFQRVSLNDYSIDGEHTLGFDGESFYGSAMISRLKYNSRHLSFMLNYNQVSPSYRTASGYDPMVDYRDASINGNYRFYMNGTIFERITPAFYMARRWHFDGTRKFEVHHVELNFRTRYAQTGFEIAANYNAERFLGRRFEDLSGFHFGLYSTPLQQVGFNFGVDYRREYSRGYLATGNETNFFAGIMLKPIDRLIIEPNFNFVQNYELETGQELYKGFISRTRLRFQANRQLSLRLVVQYNDFSEAWDFDPLITYRLSSFSVFYAGSTYSYSNLPIDDLQNTDWTLTSRQYFLKLQYLFQT